MVQTFSSHQIEFPPMTRTGCDIPYDIPFGDIGPHMLATYFDCIELCIPSFDDSNFFTQNGNTHNSLILEVIHMCRFNIIHLNSSCLYHL